MPEIGIGVFISIVSVLAAAGLFLLIRFRHKKALARVTEVSVYKEEGEGWTFLRTLKELPGRLRVWLLFRRCLMLRRGTYEEAFLRISRLAGRRGAPRAVSETPKAYLNRLVALLSKNGDGTEVPEVVNHFGALVDTISAAIDMRLYSAVTTEYTLIPQGEAKRLHIFLGAIGKLRLRKRV